MTIISLTNLLSKCAKENEVQCYELFLDEVLKFLRDEKGSFVMETDKCQLLFLASCNKLFEYMFRHPFCDKVNPLGKLEEVVKSLEPLFDQLTCNTEQYFYSFYCLFWNQSCQLPGKAVDSIHYLRIQSMVYLSKCKVSNLPKLTERMTWAIQSINTATLMPLYLDGVITVLNNLEKNESKTKDSEIEISKVMLLHEISAKCLILTKELFPIFLAKCAVFFDTSGLESDTFWPTFENSLLLFDQKQCSSLFAKYLCYSESVPFDSHFSNVAVLAAGKMFLAIAHHQSKNLSLDLSCCMLLLKLLKKLYSVLSAIPQEAISVVFESETGARTAVLKTVLFFIDKFLPEVSTKLDSSDVNLIAGFRHNAVSLIRHAVSATGSKEMDEQIIHLGRIIDTMVWKYAATLYHTKCNYEAVAMLLTASCCDTLEFFHLKTKEEQLKVPLFERLQSIVDCRIRSKAYDKLYTDLGKCLSAAVRSEHEEFIEQILEVLPKIHSKADKSHPISTLDLLQMSGKQQWTTSQLTNLLTRELAVTGKYHPPDVSFVAYLAKQLIDLNFTSYTIALGKVYLVSSIWWDLRNPNRMKDLKKGVELADEAIVLVEKEKEWQDDAKSEVLLSLAYIWKFWCMKTSLELKAQEEVSSVENLIGVAQPLHKGDEPSENLEVVAGFSFLNLSCEENQFSLLERAVDILSSGVSPSDCSVSSLKVIRSAAYAFSSAGRVVWKAKVWNLLIGLSSSRERDPIFLEAVSELLRLGILPSDDQLLQAQKIADTFSVENSRSQQILALKFSLAQAWALYFMKQYSASMACLQKVIRSPVVGRDAHRTKTVCVVQADANGLESRLLCLPKELLYQKCEPYLPHLIGPLEASRDSSENALQVVAMYKAVSETTSWGVGDTLQQRCDHLYIHEYMFNSFLEFLGQYEMVLGILFDAVAWRLKVLNHVAQPVELIETGKAALFYAQANGLATRTIELLIIMALADLLVEKPMNAAVKIQSISRMLGQDKKNLVSFQGKQLPAAVYSPGKPREVDDFLRDASVVTNGTSMGELGSSPALKIMPQTDKILLHAKTCDCILCRNLPLLVLSSVFVQVTSRTKIMLGEGDSSLSQVWESFDRITTKIVANVNIEGCDSKLFCEYVSHEHALNTADAIFEYAILLGTSNNFGRVKMYLKNAESILCNTEGPLSMTLQGLLIKFHALTMEYELAVSEDEPQDVLAGVTDLLDSLTVSEKPIPRPVTPTRTLIEPPLVQANAPKKGGRPGRGKKAKTEDLVNEWDEEIEIDMEAKQSRLLSGLKFELPPETPAPKALEKPRIRVYTDDDTELLSKKGKPRAPMIKKNTTKSEGTSPSTNSRVSASIKASDASSKARIRPKRGETSTISAATEPDKTSLKALSTENSSDPTSKASTCAKSESPESKEKKGRKPVGRKFVEPKAMVIKKEEPQPTRRVARSQSATSKVPVKESTSVCDMNSVSDLKSTTSRKGEQKSIASELSSKDIDGTQLSDEVFSIETEPNKASPSSSTIDGFPKCFNVSRRGNNAGNSRVTIRAVSEDNPGRIDTSRKGKTTLEASKIASSNSLDGDGSLRRPKAGLRGKSGQPQGPKSSNDIDNVTDKLNSVALSDDECILDSSVVVTKPRTDRVISSVRKKKP